MCNIERTQCIGLIHRRCREGPAERKDEPGE